MRRRDFIKAITVSAGWPLATRAQQGERMQRIGVLGPFADDDVDAKTWFGAFQQGLQALGWEQGQNIRIEYRFGERATLSSWLGVDSTYFLRLVRQN